MCTLFLQLTPASDIRSPLENAALKCKDTFFNYEAIFLEKKALCKNSFFSL